MNNLKKIDSVSDINNFYRKGGFFSVFKLYAGKNYGFAVKTLIINIHSNKKTLLLELCFLKNGFVNTYVNDYSQINHAVIRNYAQLISLAQKLKVIGKVKEAEKCMALAQRSIKKGSALLLVDYPTNNKQMFCEIIHEINAWLSAGILDKKQLLYCLVNDWRKYIRSKPLYQLDNQILTIKNE